jgi:OOP family OmpA-OmpF porin
VLLDTDLDGVIDLNDKCVTVPGPIQNNGCPVEATPQVLPVKEIAIDEINKYFNGIEFELNKDVIRPKSYPDLDKAADIIKTLGGDSQFIVVGATDSRGSAQYNKKLSQARANAVLNYLIIKVFLRMCYWQKEEEKKILNIPNVTLQQNARSGKMKLIEGYILWQNK